MRFRDSSSTKKNERFHYWNLTIDRLYGNSKGKSRIRRCFAEWITRMDQLEEMREKEQVGDVETSGSRTSGKGTFSDAGRPSVFGSRSFLKDAIKAHLPTVPLPYRAPCFVKRVA